ncbi:ABC transporter permease subunit [Lacibacterium aquatile]|uniref:ABC transporter permease subunit n=1 Tax=Lacibacterium aquatile TaxID=1168082 RepID=A0ABW5DWC1_9PROT
MVSFILRQVAMVIPTIIGITLLAFVMVRLVPGDPVQVMVGDRTLTPEAHAEALKALGLDRPVMEQYAMYIGRVLQGDFGKSIYTKESVLTEFFDRFPATLELSISAILFAVIIGLPAGIIAAVRRRSVSDYSVMTVALTGYSMPIFWWALILVLLFSLTLGWTPVSGRLALVHFIEPITGFLLIDTLIQGEYSAFWSALRHLVLPTIALGTIPMAVIARMTRSAMLEVLQEDYVRTARAKGLSPFRVISIHALRNALIPVVTVIGLQVSTLFSGAVLTETIFSWPGVGKWLIEALSRRDYPILQGALMLIASVVIVVNLLMTLTYGMINPRIRSKR